MTTPEPHGGSFGGDDYPIHYPYSGSNETTYGPALSAHLKAANAAVVRVSLMSLTATNATPVPVGAVVRVSHISLTASSPAPGPLALYRIAADGTFVPLTLYESTTAGGGTWS